MERQLKIITFLLVNIFSFMTGTEPEEIMERAELSVGPKTKRTRTVFTPPTVDEVRDYCNERNNSVDPVKFVNWYSARGWKVGKEKMSDWKAAVRTWEDRKREDEPKGANSQWGR